MSSDDLMITLPQTAFLSSITDFLPSFQYKSQNSEFIVSIKLEFHKTFNLINIKSKRIFNTSIDSIRNSNSLVAFH